MIGIQFLTLQNDLKRQDANLSTMGGETLLSKLSKL